MYRLSCILNRLYNGIYLTTYDHYSWREQPAPINTSVRNPERTS